MKKQVLYVIKFALLAAAAASLTACAASSSPEAFRGGQQQTRMTPEQAMAGASEQVQALYKENCMSCHASNLEGRVGPKTNLQQVGARLDKEAIAKQITGGGNGMPFYQGKLKPEEINALADWLAQKK